MRLLAIALLLIFLGVVLSHEDTSSSNEHPSKSKHREESLTRSRHHDHTSEEYSPKQRKNRYRDDGSSKSKKRNGPPAKTKQSDESWTNPKYEDLTGPQAKYQDETDDERRSIGGGTDNKQVNNFYI